MAFALLLLTCLTLVVQASASDNIAAIGSQIAEQIYHARKLIDKSEARQYVADLLKRGAVNALPDTHLIRRFLVSELPAGQSVKPFSALLAPIHSNRRPTSERHNQA